MEADLSSRLGAGRSAVRTALTRLAQEGLIEQERNRGARVRKIGKEEAIQIYEARAALEALAARRARRTPRPRTPARCARILGEMRGRLDAGDLLGASDHNARLHRRCRPRPRLEAGNGTSGPKRHAAPPNEPRGRATPGSPAVDPSLGAGVDARQRLLDAAGDMRRERAPRRTACAKGPKAAGLRATGVRSRGGIRGATERPVRSGTWQVFGTDLRLDMPSDPAVVARDVPGRGDRRARSRCGPGRGGVGAQAAGRGRADAEVETRSGRARRGQVQALGGKRGPRRRGERQRGGRGRGGR